MIIKRFLSIYFPVLIVLYFAVGITGCARYGKVILEDDRGEVIIEVDQGDDEDYYYESTLPAIPPGHMPPPGQCRIWFPGKPPGQQPPPGDCWELKRRVPPGAWLIRGR